jgi:hypothetical protein
VRWWVNRYSYLIFSALALGGAALVGSRFGGAAGPGAILGAGAALALAQASLRGRSSAPDWRAVQETTRAGLPTLLFIYSDT